MYIVLTSAVILNILSIIMLLIGLFYTFKQPQNKAVYGYSLAGCMFLCIIALVCAVIYGFFGRHYLYCFVLLLCVISNFIIGKLVKYETLKKYTAVQIMFYIISLVTLLLNF